jgi:hypothetical protein
LHGLFVSEEIFKLIIDGIYVYSDVFLKFLEDKHFAWCFRVTTNAYLVKLIVFEEGLGTKQFPSHAVMHFLDYIIVPIFAHVGETSSEHNITPLFARQKHFFK